MKINGFAIYTFISNLVNYQVFHEFFKISDIALH